MTDIWQRWANHYRAQSIDPHSICRDGIANPDRFATAQRRVLFVMREANAWPGGDVTSIMREGPRFQVWHAIGRWASGVLLDFPPYDSIDNRDTIHDSLQQVASINLKKSTGGSSSDLNVINAYAWQDRQLLREQINQIDATVVIACGTFNELLWVLDLPVKPDSPRDLISYGEQNRLVVPWIHPSRSENRKSYEHLASLLSPRVSNTR